MILAFATMVSPVLGASGQTYLYGNPISYCSLEANPGSIQLNLDPANSPAIDSSLELVATCNDPFKITVVDSSSRAAHFGYMANYTGSAYDSSPLDQFLAAPLQLVGTTNDGTTEQTVTPPIINTPQTLYLGSNPQNGQHLPSNTFTQPVAYTDARLPSSSAYRIDLTFAIGPQ